MTFFDIAFVANCLFVPYIAFRAIHGMPMQRRATVCATLISLAFISTKSPPGAGVDAVSLEASVAILGGTLVTYVANAIRLIARLSCTKFADQLADGFVTALAGFGRK